jgi:glycosyltransferase involved in cell wall biosynthesis
MIELSVIIATYNRLERLRACLAALTLQSQSAREFEVIVVVDGSADGTQEMLADLQVPYLLRVISQKNSGQCVALNRGVQAACGRVCLFLDDDILVSPDLIQKHLAIHRESDNCIGVGQIDIRLPEKANWFAKGFARKWREHYAKLNRQLRPLCWTDCYGGNLSVSREAFLEAGGFATDLLRGYDVELAYRLQERGASCVYLADAMAYQDERKGFSELTADSENAGLACVEIWRRYPATLPFLLGGFTEANVKSLLLRRFLLMLRIPPRWLSVFGWFFGKSLLSYQGYLFLQSYCFWRGVQKAVADRETWRRLTHGTAILMYHSFAGHNQSASCYTIPIRRFQRQMAWLKWMRFSVLSLEEYLLCRKENRLPPAGSVVITIDDGYADNHTLAYPILRHYGFSATVFLVSERVGAFMNWDDQSELFGRPLLSWPEIMEMKRGGIQFGAHTQTHSRLTTLPVSQLRQEIEAERQALGVRIGGPVNSFAYPFGEYESTTKTVVEQAGYWGSCTVHSGLNTAATPLYALRRFEIFGTDSLLRFIVTLGLGKRWPVGNRKKRTKPQGKSTVVIP